MSTPRNDDSLAGMDDSSRESPEMHVLPVAFGVGGKRGHLVGALGSGLRLGGLVIVDDGSSEPLVGQVEELEIVERDRPDQRAGVLRGATRPAPRLEVVRHLVGEMALLGRLSDSGFVAEVPSDGFAESPYRLASEDESRSVFERVGGRGPMIEIGQVVGSAGIPAQVSARGFTRHTFLCGQSGSGKTYATGVLLERLRLATALPIVVLDPNSDHVHLGEVRDGLTGPTAEAYQSISDQVLVARARNHGGDCLLALHFSDLHLAGQTTVLGLDPVTDLDAYAAFRQVTESLEAPFSVADVVAAALQANELHTHLLATRIENLGVADWGIWCRPGEESLVEASPLRSPCLVLDLGSLDLAAERLFLATVVLRVLWMRRDEKQPMLLVVDEAHNVFPAVPETPEQQVATELGIAIAAEGRKYGIHLLVATQRPSKVHVNVVSQCDNLALLRVNSVTDVEDLCRLFSHVPAGLIRQSPEFSQGEMLLAGPVAGKPHRIQIGSRLSPEGGGDLPTDWTTRN